MYSTAYRYKRTLQDIFSKIAFIYLKRHKVVSACYCQSDEL